MSVPAAGAGTLSTAGELAVVGGVGVPGTDSGVAVASAVVVGVGTDAVGLAAAVGADSLGEITGGVGASSPAEGVAVGVGVEVGSEGVYVPGKPAG